jgi:YD repeat-containing protein
VCEDADGDEICNQTLAAWEYDRLGRRIQAWYGGGDASSASSGTAFFYEIDSDLARLEHEFELGQSGERTVTFSHSYDAAGRLSATHVDESGWTWSAGSTAFTRDYANDIETDANASLDQVDGWSDSGGSSASQTLSYDLNGNLIATSGRLTVHDSRNRLSAYSGNTYNASTGLPTGSSQTSTLHYDADGRRVSMTDSNGTDLGFIHAGDMEIADLDLEGGTYNGVLRRYIPGAATDERVAMITVNPATGATIAREYYHANRLGSVIAMADETGAITAQYVYTPYGVESPYNASGNPFRYTGRRLDAQWGVYYYRARYYDPQLGRFLGCCQRNFALSAGA